MVDDQVQHDADVSSMGLTDESLHILEGSVQGVDIFIVGNVVSHVNLGTVIHRADPYNIYT